MDTILNFKIGLAGNSKLNIQHSKFKIGIADNSKLKTQNSTSHPSILFISILFASLTLEMSTESRYTSVVFMDLCHGSNSQTPDNQP
jgi:hypothetical protein